MPYSIDWRDNNVIVTLSGTVSFKDIDAADGILYGDIRFEQMNYQVFDLSPVEFFDVSEKEMKIISALDKNSSFWNQSMKVALVSGNQKIIELLEVYRAEMSKTEWEIGIFPNLEQALKWCESLAYSLKSAKSFY